MKTNLFKKIVMIALFITASATTFAQQTTGDIGKQTEANTFLATPTNVTGSIKLVDNKGTIKYLQSSNGITQLSDETEDGGVITTWQLGGTLNTTTTIATNDNAFNVNANGGDTGDFNVNASSGGDINISVDPTNGSVLTINGLDVETISTGLSVLVKDGSDVVKEMAITDLLQVQSGRQEFTGVTNIALDAAEDLTGSPVGLNANSVYVFRNGAKLRAGTDYTVANNVGNTASAITLLGTPADWTLITGDVIEVHWLK